MAGDAFLGQLPLDDVLRCDAGVVGARDPEGLVALHAAPPDQDVLQGLVHAVAEVQRPGDVGRRHDDGVRLPLGVGVRAEVAAFFPEPVEAFLDLVGVVDLRQLGHGASLAEGLWVPAANPNQLGNRGMNPLQPSNRGMKSHLGYPKRLS